MEKNSAHPPTEARKKGVGRKITSKNINSVSTICPLCARHWFALKAQWEVRPAKPVKDKEKDHN